MGIKKGGGGGFSTQLTPRDRPPLAAARRIRHNSMEYTYIGCIGKGKAVPLEAWTGPEGSRKLMFPDFVTTAHDGGRLSALRTGRLYPQEIFLVLISVRG